MRLIAGPKDLYFAPPKKRLCLFDSKPQLLLLQAFQFVLGTEYLFLLYLPILEEEKFELLNTKNTWHQLDSCGLTPPFDKRDIKGEILDYSLSIENEQYTWVRWSIKSLPAMLASRLQRPRSLQIKSTIWVSR
jgi:hypothetical protein